MNPVEWMQQSGYIKKRIASIYLPNYDGTETPADIKKEEEYNLPPAHIRFGDYNTTGLAKENEIYFWTTTSQFNWTLDLVEV